MLPEFAATLAALNDAEQAKAGAEPVTAFRAALTTFLETHEKTGAAWAKRDASATVALPGINLWNYNTLWGDAIGAGKFACKNCVKIQATCLCQACGNAGPGNCCWSCGRELAYSCPKCAAPWMPLQLEDVAGGGRMTGLVKETRMSDDKKRGFVRAILTGDVEDDYGTTISPRAISKLIKPRQTIIDIDHQVCKHGRTTRQGCDEHDGPIDGADCSSVTFAKVPYQGKNVEAAIVDTEFDLSLPRSKMLYSRIEDGTYPELSVVFEYPKAVAEAVAAGRQKTLDESNLISAPAYTFTRKGHASNPMAKVTEIRTSRVIETRSLTAAPVTDAQAIDQTATDKANGVTAPVEAKPADATTPPPAAIPEADAIIADLKKAVDAFGEGAAIPPVTEPEVSPAPAAPDAPAGGAPAPSLEALSQKVDALSSVVEGLRTAAAPSQEWRPGIDALSATVTAMRTLVDNAIRDTADKLEGQRKLIAECAVLQQKGYRAIKAEIARLTTIPRRESHSGADNADLSEAMRTVLEPDPETKRQRAKDAQDESLSDFLGRVSVSPL